MTTTLDPPTSNPPRPCPEWHRKNVATPPRTILLTPWGEVQSSNGSFFVDEESVTAVVAEFNRHGTDLPIDYEHQTLGGEFASPDGTAPAAGWITGLNGKIGKGIFARIKWTPQARTRLEAREYRYLSPVALVRKSDRKLVAIHSAALTNKPAIVGMIPIVNQHQNGGSPETATVDNRHVLRAAREELNVLKQRIENLKKENEQLELSMQENRIRNKIQDAVNCGKLAPHLEDWATNLLNTDETLFDEWLKAAPPLIMTGKIIRPENRESTGTAAASARCEYRASDLLQKLTSEKAYVALAEQA